MKTFTKSLLIVAILAIGIAGCAGKKIENPTVNDTIYKVFETAQGTYTIAHGSIVRVSRIANGVGVIACKENEQSQVCKTARGYAKFYKETLFPASVKADKAYKDAQTAAGAYLSGTSEGATLEEKLKAFTDAMNLFQKYFDDSDAMAIVGSVGGDQ